MCINPVVLTDGTYPCGKCYYCQLKRVNGWVLRLTMQEKISDSAYFITLTYENESNDKNSDVARITPNNRRTLVKRDLQLYFKRLRKVSAKHGRRDIKYYAVGEYGTKSGRPHYHAIVFNASDVDIRAKWIHGFVHVGTVTSSSISYCLKYVHKGRVVPVDDTDDREKEFSVSSQRLGTNYLTPAVMKWHNEDPVNRTAVTMPGGFKLPLPRYFKDKIFDIKTRGIIQDYYQALADVTLKENMLTEQKWSDHKKRMASLLALDPRVKKYIATLNEKL